MRHIKDVCEKMARELGITLDCSQKERFFLDRIVDKEELSNAKLICITARPGLGKTTLALDFVLPEAMETAGKTLIFSSEKTAEQMVSQFIMKICGINICLMSRTFADPKKKIEFTKTLSFLSGLNIYIEDFEENDDAELSYIERAVGELEDVRLVLLDGLYCFWTEAKEERIGEKLQAEALVRVKTLSHKKDIPVIITTYMSRAEIKRVYGENKLDNVFFKSGVDVLLVLHRAAVVPTDFTNASTDLLLVNKSGNYIKEILYYDTKYRRFVKLVD